MWKYNVKRFLLCVATVCFLIPSLSATEWKFQDYPGSVDINSRLELNLNYKNVAIEDESPTLNVTRDRTTYTTEGLFEVIILPKRPINNDLEGSGEIELVFNTDGSTGVNRANVKISGGNWYGKLGKEEVPDAYILGLDILVETVAFGPAGYGVVDIANVGFTAGYKSGNTGFQVFLPFSSDGNQNTTGARPFLETSVGMINFVGAIESQNKRSVQDKKTKRSGSETEKSPVETAELFGYGFTIFATPPLTEGGTEIGIAFATKEELVKTQITKEEKTSAVTYGGFGTFKLTSERWVGFGINFSSEIVENITGNTTTDTDKSGVTSFLAYHQTIGKGAAIRLAVSKVSATVEPEKDQITDSNPKTTTEALGARMRWVYRF